MRDPQRVLLLELEQDPPGVVATAPGQDRRGDQVRGNRAHRVRGEERVWEYRGR